MDKTRLYLEHKKDIETIAKTFTKRIDMDYEDLVCEGNLFFVRSWKSLILKKENSRTISLSHYSITIELWQENRDLNSPRENLKKFPI